MERSELAYLDEAHVWHPYAPPVAEDPILVAGASGVELHLADGRRVVDGMASWWSAVHGYRHPYLDQAARNQLESMSHVMFGGLTHEPAVRLAHRLAETSPGALSRVFLCDSGSVAVEVAIKVVLQHWIAAGEPRRNRLLTVRGGYHGDTFGAMSLCDPDTGMHHLFSGHVAQATFADRPPPGFDADLDERYLAALRELVQRDAEELAAVMLEPVMQGAGGMRFWNPGYLRAVREMCDEVGALLVLDEIATGFGRTGAWFASEHAGVVPDVMCVGKALTGGYLSLAATLCTDAVAGVIASGDHPQLMHGPTFMANPLACAVANASLDLLATGAWREQVRVIEACLARGLEPARDLPGVTDVRVLGAVGVIELDEAVDVTRASHEATELGVWLRPFGRLVYTTPPYLVSEEQVEHICTAMLALAHRR